ncbi:MAG: chromophore lyase CpcT/CpeT [Thermostichus sp. DG_1_6_bins_120]
MATDSATIANSDLSDLFTLAFWLEGYYSNRTQAMAEPVWFVPVSLWYVRLPALFSEGIGFFTEQFNQHTPGRFYRSRVLQLLADPLRIENYKLQDQAAWAGASQDLQRLAQLSLADLQLLPGCCILVEKRPGSYHGQMLPGGGCRLNPEDSTYIHIEFDLTPTEFITWDRGFDARTGRQTWGSRAGPYRYQKRIPPNPLPF